MALNSELQFWLAMAFLVVLLAITPQPASFWLAVGVVIAALSAAQLEKSQQGHTFFGDLANLIGGA